MLNPRIRNLVIYPVKSCGGVEVERAVLTPSGLVANGHRDHQYMVVSIDPEFIRVNKKEPNDVYHFLTQRDRRNYSDRPQHFSKMALIRPEFAQSGLSLNLYGSPIVTVPYHRWGREIPVKIWDDVTTAIDQGDDIAMRLHTFLGFPVRLVKAEGSFRRMARRTYMPNDNPLGGFQDAYPVHWFTIESVDELSQRTGQEIPWQSFRPQVVVQGMAPHGEHKILSGKFGEVGFVNAKPCVRCTITLVDQETGEIRRGGEPLRTLGAYKNWKSRKGGRSVIFGEYALPENEGIVSVGDALTVASLRDPPLRYGTLEEISA